MLRDMLRAEGLTMGRLAVATLMRRFGPHPVPEVAHTGHLEGVEAKLAGHGAVLRPAPQARRRPGSCPVAGP